MRWYHLGIKAKDSEASIRFYREVLGLGVVDTVDIWGKTFTFVGNETIRIEIEQANAGDTPADPSTMTGLNHFSVVVEDIHGLVNDARAKGVHALMEPFHPRPDRLTTFLRDPDGVLIQVIEYVNKAADPEGSSLKRP